MFKTAFILSMVLASNVSFAQDYPTKDYQLGSQWTKTVVSPELLQKSDYVYRKTAMATAQVAGGTGFYIGKFNGVHVIATNHHVCEMGAQCLGFDINFPVLNKHYELDKWVGTFKDVDLTLMTFTVPAADEALLAPLAMNFAFNHEMKLGEKLLTIGFGVSGNPTIPRSLMSTADSDCIVMSKTGEYRAVKDPDEVNPLPDPVWSFASGCDVSHGDSGSAMVDRETGEVVGILWTGKTPKDSKLQNSSYLKNLLKSPTEEIWTELTYAVPAAKMADSIYDYAFHYPYITPQAQATLLKIIGR